MGRPIFRAALFGVLLGLGLGIGTNVSGAVLAFFGLVAGTLLAVLALTAARRR